MDEFAVREYYKDHTKKETLKHFGLTKKRLDTYLSKHGIKKYGDDYVHSCDRLPEVDVDSMKEYLCDHTKKETIAHFGMTASQYNRVISILGINVHKMRFEHTFDGLDKKAFSDYYILNGQKSAMDRFGLSEKFVVYASDRLGIRDRKNILKIARYDAIDKREFVDYYKDHNREETVTHFNMGNEHFLTDYCHHIGYRKPDNIMMQNRIKTNMRKYGVPYYCMTKDFIEAPANGSNSKPNVAFDKSLTAAGIKHSREFPLGNYIYDFKVGDALVEINPTATHNSDKGAFGRQPLDRYYHRDKTLFAEANGYRCINVWDWDNVNAVIGLLSDGVRAEARKCSIRELSKSESDCFLIANHVQGTASDMVRIGLFDGDELVSVMTFGKPRYNRKYEWELIRYCSIRNVIGGAERLFRNFLALKNPSSIISYCDTSKFSGDVYRRLGFSIQRVSQPSCHWYNQFKNKHVTDNLLRQRGFDQLFGESNGKGTSNEELMLKNGFLRVYDCGQATYVWTASD